MTEEVRQHGEGIQHQTGPQHSTVISQDDASLSSPNRTQQQPRLHTTTTTTTRERVRARVRERVRERTAHRRNRPQSRVRRPSPGHDPIVAGGGLSRFPRGERASRDTAPNPPLLPLRGPAHEQDDNLRAGNNGGGEVLLSMNPDNNSEDDNSIDERAAPGDDLNPNAIISVPQQQQEKAAAATTRRFSSIDGGGLQLSEAIGPPRATRGTLTLSSAVAPPDAPALLPPPSDVPLEQTTRVIKQSHDTTAENGQRPGAYQIRGRAVGTRPIWNLHRLHQSIRNGVARSFAQRSQRSRASSRTPSRRPTSESQSSDDNQSVAHSLDDDLESYDLLSGVFPTNVEKQRQIRSRVVLFVAVVIVVIVGAGAGFGVGRFESDDDDDDVDMAAPVDSSTTLFSVNQTSLEPTNAPTIRCNLGESTIKLPDAFASCACLETSSEIPAQYVSVLLNARNLMIELYQSIDEYNMYPILEGCHPHNIALQWMTLDVIATTNNNVDSWISRYLLAALFAMWANGGRNNWVNFTGWLSTASECEWAGVACLEGTKIISMLDLGANGLNGSNVGIPVEVYLMKELRILNLTSSELGSTISANIRRLTNLEVIDLSNNKLRGKIPGQLYELTNLRSLELGDNKFEDTSLSPSIGRLTNLEYLGLQSASLSGTIPTEIGRLTNLIEFRSDENQFLDGGLPSEIGRLSSLQKLNVSLCSLTGTLPTEVGYLTSMTNLILGGNHWNGTFPSEVGLLKDLINLGVDTASTEENQRMKGTLPTEIGQLTSLMNLTLAGQCFEGTIPPEMGLLSDLKNMNLSHTCLTGTIPSEFGRLSNLDILNLNKVAVRGRMPSEFEQILSPRCLNFGETFLEGSIPSHWCAKAEAIVVPCSPNIVCGCCECQTIFPACSIRTFDPKDKIPPSGG